MASHVLFLLLTPLQNTCDYILHFSPRAWTDAQISINHAHITVIFVTKGHIPTLLKIAPKTPLKLIVCIDDLSEEAKKILTSWGDVQKVQILELRDSKNISIYDSNLFLTSHKVEQIGKVNPIEPFPATIEQIASICYTSVSSFVTDNRVFGLNLEIRGLPVTRKVSFWSMAIWRWPYNPTYTEPASLLTPSYSLICL